MLLFDKIGEGLSHQGFAGRHLMQLLADENVPLKAVQLLREKGHDVLSISESMPRTADEDILEIVTKESQIVLTFDKDFGD